MAVHVLPTDEFNTKLAANVHPPDRRAKVVRTRLTPFVKGLLQRWLAFAG
jgi:hypothetical protein